MEKNSKGDNKNKKKDKLLVVYSETQLGTALSNKTPFQLGPSFESIRLPLSIGPPSNNGLVLKSLKDNTTLKTITFGRCIWDKSNLDALEKSLIANRSIDTLQFSYFSFQEANKKFMKTLAKILTKNNRIQHVTFEIIDDNTDYNIFDPFCQNIHLFGLKSLEIVELCHLHMIAIFQALPNSPTITSLRVKFAHQNMDVFSSMVDALMANPKITDLEVGPGKGEIGGDRWIKFAPVLERDHLKRLIITNLHYHNNWAVQEDFDNVISIIQRSKNLEEFGFSYGNLKWKFLGDILSANKSIKKLYMQGSYLEEFSLLKLDQNETLTEVTFSNCYLAGTYLPKLISHNTTIRKMQFETHHLNQEEYDSFLKALKKNSTLTDFQLLSEYAFTPLSDLFAEVLSVNRSLRRLKFHFPNCEYESACRFADALKINTTLRELVSLTKVHLIYIGSQDKPPGAPTFDLLLADVLHVNESLTRIRIRGVEEFPEINAALKRNSENQRKLIINGKMFVKMLAMRPRSYGGIIPPEIWCMILGYVTVPGADWDAEQFYRQSLS